MSEFEWPSGWATTTVGEIRRSKLGGIDPAQFGDEKFESYSVPAHAVRAPEVISGNLIGSAKQLVEPGCVLLCKINPRINRVWVVSERATYRQIASTEWIAFPRLKGLEPRFLGHFLGREQVRKHLATNVSGVGGSLMRVRPVVVDAISIPIAPSDEQRRIADKLDEIFSDLDAGDASLQRAQAKLKRYRASVLKAAVEGRLTADWRQANPPAQTGTDLLARLLRERRERWEAAQLAKFEASGKAAPKDWRKKYVEPAAPDTSKLPALPAGWCWASAETLCGFITKGTTPDRSQRRGASDIDAVPFVRVTNLTTSGQLDAADLVFVSRSAHESELGRSLVLPGDVLMNIVGPPLGQVSIVPASYSQWNMNQAVAVFRPVAGMDVAFFCSFLLSHTAQTWLGERAKTSAGQVNLTLELCRALPVPVPPIAEQCAISRLVENADAATVRSVAAVEQGLIRSRALRQATLEHAFAGKLVPQDPNDEPAAVLLDRIRSAHAAAHAKPREPRRPTAKSRAAKTATVARPSRKRRGSV